MKINFMLLCHQQLSYSQHVCLFLSLGIGTMAFDTRLGLYSDAPSPEGLKFIAAVHDFFDLSQKLLVSIPSNMLRPYMDTPALKKFFEAADEILDIGEIFINRKMKELKEMKGKGIESPGKGNYKRCYNSYVINAVLATNFRCCSEAGISEGLKVTQIGPAGGVVLSLAKQLEIRGKNHTQAPVVHLVRAYSGSCCLKQQRVLLPPPGRDASSSHYYPTPPPLNNIIPIYTPEQREVI